MQIKNLSPSQETIKSLGSFRFCPKCGTIMAVASEGDRDRLACPKCRYIYYRNPVPACGAIVERDGRILLVRRAFEPKKGMWSIPAGFMEYGETPQDCCTREVEEETGLAVRIQGLLGVYSGFDDPRFHAVLVVYIASDPGGDPLPGDDADETGWFDPQDLPDDMAFRAHLEAISDFCDRRHVTDSDRPHG